MQRIAPVTSSPDPDISALIEAIKAQRDGKLLMLYKVLLNSPAVTNGWLQMMTSIRQKTTISPALRELIILRIAILNDAPYEFAAHVPYAQRAGLDDGLIEAVRTGVVPDSLPERERAVIAYTDAMTRTIKVGDSVYAAVAAHFNEQQIVEITATVASYNMVSRFLVALNIEHEH